MGINQIRNKTMKLQQIATAGMLLSGILATSAMGDQVKIDWFNGGHDGASLGTFSSGKHFTTFCLEDGEYFYSGRWYDYTKNQDVIQGWGSSLPHSPNIPLTVGAVNLYKDFLSDTGAAGAASATDVQYAIWASQGYGAGVIASLLPYIDSTAYTGNSYYAVNQFDASNSDGLNGYGGVAVAGLRQSFINAPDGGSTSMLMGLGLTAVGFVSRRMRK